MKAKLSLLALCLLLSVAIAYGIMEPALGMVSLLSISLLLAAIALRFRRSAKALDRCYLEPWSLCNPKSRAYGLLYTQQWQWAVTFGIAGLAMLALGILRHLM